MKLVIALIYLMWVKVIMKVVNCRLNYKILYCDTVQYQRLLYRMHSECS